MGMFMLVWSNLWKDNILLPHGQGFQRGKHILAFAVPGENSCSSELMLIHSGPKCHHGWWVDKGMPTEPSVISFSYTVRNE